MTAATGILPARPVVDAARGAATWRALGTHVDLRAAPEVVERASVLAEDVLHEVDRTCSRFRDDSDLVRANRAAGRATAVSPVLVGAVRVALEAAVETGGVVDPTLGAVVAGSGYDRPFDLVPPDDPEPAALPMRRGSWRDTVVTDSTITVPVGAALDLGSVGKAFAADLVALTLLDELAASVLVSIGGDVRVVSPDGVRGAAHRVVLGHSVADLRAGGHRGHVRLRDGGLATSSTSARRWRRGGRQWHHLVDPRTGLPAAGPWRTVSALGRTAVAANAASTAAVVLGDDARAWLEHRGVAARLVSYDERVVRTEEWKALAPEVEP